MELLPTKRTVTRVAAPPTHGGLAKGMDFVFVILAFCGLGWVLDQVFDTEPWLTIGGLVFGVVGQFVRMWYAYDADMRVHEARLLEGRGR